MRVRLPSTIAFSVAFLGLQEFVLSWVSLGYNITIRALMGYPWATRIRPLTGYPWVRRIRPLMGFPWVTTIRPLMGYPWVTTIRALMGFPWVTIRLQHMVYNTIWEDPSSPLKMTDSWIKSASNS